MSVDRAALAAGGIRLASGIRFSSIRSVPTGCGAIPTSRLRQRGCYCAQWVTAIR